MHADISQCLLIIQYTL